MEIQKNPEVSEKVALSIDEHKDFPSFCEWFRDFKAKQRLEADKRWNIRHRRR